MSWYHSVACSGLLYIFLASLLGIEVFFKYFLKFHFPSTLRVMISVIFTCQIKIFFFLI